MPPNPFFRRLALIQFRHRSLAKRKRRGLLYFFMPLPVFTGKAVALTEARKAKGEGKMKGQKV